MCVFLHAWAQKLSFLECLLQRFQLDEEVVDDLDEEVAVSYLEVDSSNMGPETSMIGCLQPTRLIQLEFEGT